MSVDRGERRGWVCGRSGKANLRCVSSIVREMREPCLKHSPTKRNKMLKQENWQTICDSEGKVIGFRKALKLIVSGGIDPSIRAEVWEFLLGCYALSSTSEYRRKLRMARRERYEDLIKQCHTMHSSIGTGKLAYVVGSKVMDVRTPSNEHVSGKTVSEQDCHYSYTKEGAYSGSNNLPSDKSNSCEFKSMNSGELPSFRTSTAATAYNYSSRNSEIEFSECQYARESFYDIPPLPATNLVKKDNRNENGSNTHGSRNSSPEHLRTFGDEHMYSFQISNNVDLVMEADTPSASNNKARAFHSDSLRHSKASKQRLSEKDIDLLEILPNLEPTTSDNTITNQLVATDDKVAEWLWTLHRIVVDVVRTDSHLDFYGDSKNVARMSDILAVYAWVDPSTGYCQGMSDLLSPFVVLYEDNADAFWCFEMLLRRMRENFQMEGPTGVMKQLQELWKILELTDADIFQHLSVIGTESLHFAFRMLLVLFRRELSFDEAFCMWEMMWAADFDEAICQQLEESCLEPLVLQIRKSSSENSGVPVTGSGKRKLKKKRSHRRENETCNNGIKSISIRPFFGFSKSKFWLSDRQIHLSTTSVTRHGKEDIPVFCVAAILIINRQKIFTGAQSIDDVIKMFNDNELKFNVKRCISTAIKLRKKYFYKVVQNIVWTIRMCYFTCYFCRRWVAFCASIFYLIVTVVKAVEHGRFTSMTVETA